MSYWVGVDMCNMHVIMGRAGWFLVVGSSLSPQGDVQQSTVIKCHLTEDKNPPCLQNLTCFSYLRHSEECFRKLQKRRAKKQRKNNRNQEVILSNYARKTVQENLLILVCGKVRL